MMSTNRSGDCCSHTLVNAICTNIKSLALSEHDTLLDLIQKIFTEMLHKSVNIHLIIQDNRHFPQLFIEEDSMLCIRCFCDRTFDRNNISQWKDIYLQLSIAVVLSCCSRDFVENSIELDESFKSFSIKWPSYANMTSRIYNLMLAKTIPE